MRKIYNLIFILLSITPIFSNAGLLKITSESISSLFLNEVEYNQSKYYKEGIEFSEGLEIYSKTDGSHIYLNGKKYSNSKLKFNNLGTGLYHIKINKSGYKSIDRWINIAEGKRVIITVTLAREFGYLNIECNVPDFQIYLNNFLVDNNIAVPSGSYMLKVKSFGYTEVIKTIYIIDSFYTNEKILLNEAPFLLEQLIIEKPRFNPYANEGFKSNQITIKVNGPGSGILKIQNSAGIDLFIKNLEFKTWLTTIEYTGLDQNKNYLDDANYIVLVNSDEQELNETFVIDSTLFYRKLTLYRGFSGLLAAPTAELNRYPIRQTSFSIGSNLNSPNISLPVSFCASIVPNLNFLTGFDLTLSKNNEASTGLYLGLYYGFNFDFLLMGINVNYRFESVQTEASDNLLYHNIFLNIPLTFNAESFYLSITPEYKFTINENDTIGTGVGLHYDNQKYRFGISGRIDIKDTIQKYYYGIEGSLLLPKSQSYVGLSLSGNEDLDLSLMIDFTLLY